MIKIIAIVLLLVIGQTSTLCNVCIRTTELLQGGIIALTPTFVAEDIVKSVCEKQCTLLMT